MMYTICLISYKFLEMVYSEKNPWKQRLRMQGVFWAQSEFISSQSNQLLFYVMTLFNILHVENSF